MHVCIYIYVGIYIKFIYKKYYMCVFVWVHSYVILLTSRKMLVLPGWYCRELYLDQARSSSNPTSSTYSRTLGGFLLALLTAADIYIYIHIHIILLLRIAVLCYIFCTHFNVNIF